MIHPVTGNRTRFLVWWLIWLLTGLGQSTLLYFTCRCGTLAPVADGLLSALVYGLIAIAIWYPATQFKPKNRNIPILVLNHVSVAALSLLTWLFSVRWLTASILSEKESYMEFWQSSLYFRIGAGIFIYAVVVLSYHLMMSMENIARKNMREANLENMLRETELMALRSQINPHFLFNSLNSISSLTVTDPSRAREMVIKLSEFMRYALSRKEDKSVPLSTELENLRLYLDIEKVRFGNKLRVIEEFDPESLSVKIPNMILQPLYENAIKHGVYESIGEVVVHVVTIMAEGGITIKIENDFDPENIPASGTGTGLRNIKRRLELYYRDEAMLQTHKEGNRFIAEIFIPGSKAG